MTSSMLPSAVIFTLRTGTPAAAAALMAAVTSRWRKVHGRRPLMSQLPHSRSSHPVACDKPKRQRHLELQPLSPSARPPPVSGAAKSVPSRRTGKDDCSSLKDAPMADAGQTDHAQPSRAKKPVHPTKREIY